MAKGKFQPDPTKGFVNNRGERELETVPFDFGHLQSPVPASVYYDARSEDCWGIKQTHCGTITDDMYRPQLMIKNKVWASIAPKWYACQRPELVDPPIVLSSVDTLKIPTCPRKLGPRQHRLECIWLSRSQRRQQVPQTKTL